jgi:flagellar biosynthetic protein FlhB
VSGETGEKTEEATPEKLRKAKEEGQVPKSQDFVGALGFAVGFFTMVAVFAYIYSEVRAFALTAIEAGLRRPTDQTIADLMGDAIPVLLKVSLPIGVAVFIIGVFSNVVQTGFFLAFKVLTPKLEKINPVNGLKGLFKVKKFVELIKNVVKMAAAAWLAYDVMKSALYDMTLVVTLPIGEAVIYSSTLVWEYLLKTSALFIFIGVLDLIWSRKQFFKEQMMSKYDVKQEYKQSEGDPQMKGQRKQLAQELLFGGGGEAVKNADAVVVNPAHIAVAIKYDADGDKAPRVVAKGMRLHAEKIKELAKQYGVPILRNVPLAQALHKLDIDEEIPEELYEAVAEVLSFVFKIREEQEARQKEQAEKRAEAYRAERQQGRLPPGLGGAAVGGVAVGGAPPEPRKGGGRLAERPRADAGAPSGRGPAGGPRRPSPRGAGRFRGRD